MNSPLSPRDRALQAANQWPIQPTDVVEFSSQGRLLLLGPQARLDAVAPRLPSHRVTALCHDDLGVTGHFGAFHVALEQTPWPDAQTVFDIVIDLHQHPLMKQPWPPLGYYHAPDDETVDAQLDEWIDLVGKYEKPKFFNYDPLICAHNSRGIPACRRCLDACPAEAIISIGEKIQVNPMLCQGGGICTTVCPSGALRYRYPSTADWLNRMRLLCHTFIDATDEGPIIVLYDECSLFDPITVPDAVIPIKIEEMGCIGIESLLNTIAYGAKAVRLVDYPQLPPAVRAAMQRQLDIISSLLNGLGYPEAIGWWAEDPDYRCTMPKMTAATHLANDQKRPMLFTALDFLFDQAVNPKTTFDLPPGAPLGEVQVNRDTCTLCLSCVAVCPAQALRDGGQVPALKFIENNCLQCGLCASACPERDITLHARIRFPAAVRQTPVRLHEEPPFCCVACGKPFATPSTIEKILEKLADHPMFGTPEALRRLQMCSDCRVTDLYRSEGLGQPPAP